jgi:Putative  PD-(D/E)XK family member, (DUF4420)
MNARRPLSWENFRSTVFITGQQRVHRVADSPYIEVFGDGISNRVGIWLEILPGTLIPSEASKLAFISTRTFNQSGRSLLEIATAAPSLHRHFYHFAVAVSERIVVDKCSAAEAVSAELQCFGELFEEKSLLGVERQLGLLGELLVLERFVQKRGAGALDGWLGPVGEPHDFRFNSSEFEVKTTISPHRIHTINGPEQLVPSTGCSLLIVSVMLGPAGASQGFSLAEKVDQLSKEFADSATRKETFSEALSRCGFRDEDKAHYGRRFAMRRPLALVPVDGNFPAISRSTIQNVLGELASRIESLQYEVSIEGLEVEDGTPGFDLSLSA